MMIVLNEINEAIKHHAALKQNVNIQHHRMRTQKLIRLAIEHLGDRPPLVIACLRSALKAHIEMVEMGRRVAIGYYEHISVLLDTARKHTIEWMAESSVDIGLTNPALEMELRTKAVEPKLPDFLAGVDPRDVRPVTKLGWLDGKPEYAEATPPKPCPPCGHNGASEPGAKRPIHESAAKPSLAELIPDVGEEPEGEPAPEPKKQSETLELLKKIGMI